MPELTHKAFSENLGTQFILHLSPEKTIGLELAQVAEQQVTARQEMFSIVFRGPLDTFLVQRTYTFDHETMGTFSLFIVPISKDENGFSYEAVFNNVRKPEAK